MKHTIIWDEVAIHSALDEIESLKTELARSEERRKKLREALELCAYVQKQTSEWDGCDSEEYEECWQAARLALAQDAEELNT